MKKMNIYFSVIIITIISFLIFSSERIYYDSDFFLDVGNQLDIKFIKYGELYMKNKNSIIKKIDIELAYKTTEKINGLKYRSSLKEDQGMLFILNQKEEYKKINMENMRIPIDIIYINQFNTVCFINKSVSPMRKIDIFNFSHSTIIKYVLEINAGMSDKWGIKNGVTNIFMDF
ncbi:DUF192 domain-containing protein [Blattabacterium cuenoti]|uniref:DUF192 domain-containing protein n=1 Tax=Blattabacterium cuenoti TaxID=1653831 RepID=UPI00163C6CB4|nr:DUF192 domain-containing protein [Blattabacterium cuenoti]